jgi:uncharacterized protein
LKGLLVRKFPSTIAFTLAVKAIQERKRSRPGYARMERSGGPQTTVTLDLAAWIANLDMFYLGTATARSRTHFGQPRRLFGCGIPFSFVTHPRTG